MSETLLELRDVSVDLRRGRETLRLVQDVSLTVGRGETVGLVGESGSGKSLTAFAVLNLFPSPALSRGGGEVRLAGRALTGLTPAQWRAVRGGEVGLVFQDPTATLDPLMPVGRQIAETLAAHGAARDAARRVPELLEMMELPDPSALARRYPHELSGGQRQRVMIAAALAMRPSLLIADEPTTALDVTVQAGILRLLDRLRRELGLAILLITHDLGVVAQSCQRVHVMYAGKIVESRDVQGLFARPRHPYTAGLLRSTLSAEGRAAFYSIPGRVPPPEAMPPGCRFRPRCPIALHDPCELHPPPLMPRSDGADACWRSEDTAALPAGEWERSSWAGETAWPIQGR
jgi:oligopeptide/dipeptide ABC transporter ATP-binding protein